MSETQARASFAAAEQGSIKNALIQLTRERDAARARIAELEAENERLRAMRHHDLHAWKHDPNGPVTQ